MNKTGFGFLRLPRLNPGDEKSTDFALLNTLVDRFLALGGRYFDTAYTYLGGASEEAIRRCLVERHPRDVFLPPVSGSLSSEADHPGISEQDCRGF